MGRCRKHFVKRYFEEIHIHLSLYRNLTQIPSTIRNRKKCKNSCVLHWLKQDIQRRFCLFVVVSKDSFEKWSKWFWNYVLKWYRIKLNLNRRIFIILQYFKHYNPYFLLRCVIRFACFIWRVYYFIYLIMILEESLFENLTQLETGIIFG